MKFPEPADEMFEACCKQAPRAMRLCYPKQIRPPNGFSNPKYFGTALFSYLIIAQRHNMSERSHMSGGLVAFQMIRYGVPTYFLADGLAEAIWNTDIPDELVLKDIKFPLDAMLFVLPDSFLARTIKYRMPFLGIARCEEGHYPKAEWLPGCEIGPLQGIKCPVAEFTAIFPIVPENRYMPVDYTAVYNLDHTVKEVSGFAAVGGVQSDEESQLEYTEVTDGLLAREVTKDQLRGLKGIPASNSEEEMKINRAINKFALKILLVLSAAPHLIEHGQEERKERTKHGITKRALWGPNVLGKTYKINYEGPSEATGVKMRMHWRRGHIRTQHHGYQNKLVKQIWIEAVLVNAPKEKDSNVQD